MVESLNFVIPVASAVDLVVVIVGNGAVGKSSMIQRYCRGTFTREYKKTIGVDFLERQIQCEGEDVRLMLWDTAGQEEFDAITKAYYRGAQACVLAFSSTDRSSFEAIHSWKVKVEDECGEIPTVLVQNKIDLVDQCVIDPKEAELLSRALGAKLIKTSVKEDINVNAVFWYLATQCLAELRRQEEEEYSMTENGLHSLTISSLGPSAMHPRYCNNGTIVLQCGKSKHKRKKSILKSVCRTN
ncbi:hypothetical protein V9T40_012346 [Parthenolecanium corni]|uniref:Ras-related protein Rab-23 n=1 Tax=Parthenolecanium corni TaxID=536013 RepID=A0AAN9Y0C8_9HEMI